MGIHSYVSTYLLEALNSKTTELEPPPIKEKMSDAERDLLLALYDAHKISRDEVWRVWAAACKENPAFIELLDSEHPGRWVIETPTVHQKMNVETPSLTQLKAALELGEIGDAKIFVEILPNTVRFDAASKLWYVWNGHAWKEDIEGLVTNMLINILLSSQFDFGFAELGKERKAADTPGATEFNREIDAVRAKLTTRANQLRTLTRRECVKNHLRSMLVFDGEWDNQPLLLPCPNGVVDLRTGNFYPGQPKHYMRRSCPTIWKGLDAKAPRWRKFMQEIFHHHLELVPFMQRLLGYAISGLTKEHIMPLFIGESARNGKDTLIETIAAVMGDLAVLANRDVLMMAKQGGGKGQATPHLHELWGRRIAWVSETAQGGSLDVNEVKVITGGGQIKSRQLHQKEISFTPTHLLILITNHKPHIPSGGDPGVWARMLLIPFLERFVANPDPNNPHEWPVDLNLKEILAEEASGILAWLVEGFLEYQKQGLNPPDIVLESTKEYQDQEDDTKAFFRLCCAEAKGQTVAAKNMFEFYQAWGGTLGSKAFGLKAKKHLIYKRTNKGGVYQDIHLVGDLPNAA